MYKNPAMALRLGVIVALLLASLVSSPGVAAACSQGYYSRNVTLGAGQRTTTFREFNYGKATRLSGTGESLFVSTTFTTIFYAVAGKWDTGPFSSTQTSMQVTNRTGGTKSYRLEFRC